MIVNGFSGCLSYPYYRLLPENDYGDSVTGKENKHPDSHGLSKSTPPAAQQHIIQ